MLRPMARSALRAAAQKFPLLSGCGTLANTPPFAWASADDTIAEARLRDGSKLFVHLNDYVGRAVFFFGDLDPKVSWLCRSTLRPGDLMLDVGGNYGLVAMLAAGLVGETGSVHVFEPQLDLVELLRRSTAANGFGQVEIHPVGLSDADADLVMNIPTENRGKGSLAHDHEGNHISVSVRQGTSYLANVLGERRPRLVKIDVEGHESSVFLGATDWIARVKPEVFVFEHNSEGSLWDLPGFAVLRRGGYRFYGIPKVTVRMRLVAAPRRTANAARLQRHRRRAPRLRVVSAGLKRRFRDDALHAPRMPPYDMRETRS